MQNAIATEYDVFSLIAQTYSIGIMYRARLLQMATELDLASNRYKAGSLSHNGIFSDPHSLTGKLRASSMICMNDAGPRWP